MRVGLSDGCLLWVRAGIVQVAPCAQHAKCLLESLTLLFDLHVPVQQWEISPPQCRISSRPGHGDLQAECRFFVRSPIGSFSTHFQTCLVERNGYVSRGRTQILYYKQSA